MMLRTDWKDMWKSIFVKKSEIGIRLRFASGSRTVYLHIYDLHVYAAVVKEAGDVLQYDSFDLLCGIVLKPLNLTNPAFLLR